MSLSSRAGRVDVLRGVDFAARAGEAVAITGPSGSGKTTLLMVIGGIEKAASGTIAVAGHDLHCMDERRLTLYRRSVVGIVFQSFHLIPALTALENVAIPGELRREDGAREAALRELDAVGLSHRVGHYPSELSGGEQQRVAIARALVGGPRVILADEPTGNLDQATGGDIIDLLFSMRERHGATLLLVTHDRALAGRCGRLVEMRDGVLVEGRT